MQSARPEMSLNSAEKSLIDAQDVFVFPTSFSQARLWFIDQLIPNQAFYNVPTVIGLKGTLNLTALEQTLNEIVRRHEVLRTTFKSLAGQPVQAIAPSLTLSLPVFNLQELSPQEREAETQRLITAEFEHSFDLASGPLLRVLLLHLDRTEYVLVLNLHHIVCDDWSIGVLIRELGTLYTAFVQNQPSPLPELSLQYADFAEWQREWLEQAGLKGDSPLQTQLNYWRQQLQGLSGLNLPTDRPKSALSTYRGATEFVEIPKRLSDALEALSQQEGTTLFMTLLAVFKILLYRYTQQEDIAVGSVIANRNRSEIEGLIGFFVNTLVLRTDLSGNPTFREVLARVREVMLGAYAHQDLPFEKLVEEFHPERNLSQHPLFQVMFGFQNAPMEALELPGLVVNPLNFEVKTTRFDLEFHLWQCSGGFRNLWGGDRWQESQGIRGVMVYNSDLFESETIARILKHFQTLIEGIVTHSEMPISELSIITEFEKNQLLFELNNTITEYPKDKSIPDLFEVQVEQNPNAIALIFADTKLTYTELNKRSNQLAHYLQQLGITEGSLIGIYVEQSVETIIGLLAILKMGCAYVPLDPSYPQERLNFMLEDAQVSVLLTQDKFVKSFEACSNQIVKLDRNWKLIAQESSQNLNRTITSHQLAYIIYTSGSTGKPKGVAVTHQAINRLVFNTNYIKIEASDKIAQTSNISFDAATFEIWGALLNGAKLVSISREVMLSPQEFALHLQQKEISILFLTTALFQQLARNVPQAFSGLRYLLFGGETVDPRWVKKVLRQGAPQHLLHVYGPTEGTTFSSYYPVQNVLESATSIPIGRPISNTQIYILDNHLQPVPVGISGELYIGGDGLSQGYLNRPDLTAHRFISHPFSSQIGAKLYRTGDLARYQSNGNIEFLGRIDNQVKIRGYRIELEEIETVLCQSPVVAEAVVIVSEEIPGEKLLIAYIVPHHNSLSTPPDLRKFLKEKLPEYMVPSAYVFLESLPLTPNGKIDRKALPSVDTLSLDIKENYVAPRTDIEQVLVGIWARVLGKEQVGIHDNFFELGGHSLLATQLTSRIRDAFQIELPVRSLFESPTVGSLAKYIETVCWATNGLDSTRSEGNEREEFEF